MEQDKINIQYAPLPFVNMRKEALLPYGVTIQDILDNVNPFDGSEVDAIVFVNGELIRKESYAICKPNISDNVAVRIVPKGGGGKKNPIASLLSIAVLIAAPSLSTAILGKSLAGQVIVGKFTLGNAFAGAIGMVGRLLINSLAPPPKPSYSGNNVANNEVPITQFIQGATNQFQPFGVVPVILGKARVFPYQAAKPYTESASNKQYVRQLFMWSMGSVVIRDEKIGETDLSDFTGIEIEHKLEGNLSDGTKIYSRDVDQQDYNVLLSYNSGFVTRTTAASTDSFAVDVTFPRGLVEYNTNGNRVSREVDIELQYAPSGTSNWSAPASSYLNVTAQSLSLLQRQSDANWIVGSDSNLFAGYRKDVVVINQTTGSASIITGAAYRTESEAVIPVLPSGTYRLATVTVYTQRSSGVMSYSVTNLTNDRDISLVGNQIQSSSSFAVTNPSALNISVASGGIRYNAIKIRRTSPEAIRITYAYTLPSRGQYDVRIRRLSPDTDSDRIFDEVYLSALKSFTNVNPVTQENLSGTAIRMLGTDQLNGAIDQYNAVCSLLLPDYDAATDTWVTRESSNPASLFRWVLQGEAIHEPLSDSEVDIATLELWHSYCQENSLTYNKYINSEISVTDMLRDICAAGHASPSRIVGGKWSVVIDKAKETITQIVTPRNSFGYTCEMAPPDQPHAFRVLFQNASKGYLTDERIVYADGYDATNATKFEQLEYLSCDNPDLAFKHGRKHLLDGKLQIRTHKFNMSIDNLVATRGDRIILAHDLPRSYSGEGRISSIIDNGSNITGFTLDDVCEILPDTVYYTRIRKQDGTFIYTEVNAAVGDNINSFTFVAPQSLSSINIDDLAYVVQAGGELDIIITSIQYDNNMNASISAIDYAPERFQLFATAPEFTSNATTPIALIRPVPPVLINYQSDESVMIANSDGSLISRALFTLQNNNFGQVTPLVRYRKTGEDEFSPARIITFNDTSVSISDLEDGSRYDYLIYYQRSGSQLLSLPLFLYNYRFEGAANLPQNVQGFRSVISGDSIVFDWIPSEDIDFSHYEIRFSKLFTGASWETAQTLGQKIKQNQFTSPFIGGTYFIKAVDILGNYSQSASTIITYDPAGIGFELSNVEEAPNFNGAKYNVIKSGSQIILDDIDDWYADTSEKVNILYTPGFSLSGKRLPVSLLFSNKEMKKIFEKHYFTQLPASEVVGYYYFETPIILSQKLEGYISASIEATGSGTQDIYNLSDIYNANNLYITDASGWYVELQYSKSNDSSSPIQWEDWTTFAAGYVEFMAIRFRLKMVSTTPSTTPSVSGLSVSINLPKRTESGNDLSVAPSGATITYDYPFAIEPSVQITIQDGATDDRIEFTSKDIAGFSFRVYNATSAAYVTRTYDYLSEGYGRES